MFKIGQGNEAQPSNPKLGGTFKSSHFRIKNNNESYQIHELCKINNGRYKFRDGLNRLIIHLENKTGTTHTELDYQTIVRYKNLLISITNTINQKEGDLSPKGQDQFNRLQELTQSLTSHSIAKLTTDDIPSATTNKHPPQIDTFKKGDKITIKGKSYEIVSHNGNNTGLLGQGAFGFTYKVIDAEGNKKALKIQRTQKGGKYKLPEQMNEFKLQYQAAKNSSNVCSVESISTLGKGRQLSCILMPLFDGDKFKKSEMDKYTDQQKINFVKDLLNIYKTLTENKVLHGDIKFENILIEEHEGKQKLKLIDFGLAKDLTEKITDHRRYVVNGTTNYLPHTFRTRDPSLDRYAICVMILEIFHLDEVESVRNEELKSPQHQMCINTEVYTENCKKGFIKLLKKDKEACRTPGMKRPLNKISEAVRDKLLQIISTDQIGSPKEFIELDKLFN